MKKIEDFSIVSVAFGNNFKKFVPEWWESIKNLERMPKEIIIVYNPNDDTGVKDLPVKLIENSSNNITEMLNVGFRAVKTKWMGSLSLDDRYFPDALNDIEYANNFDIIGCNAISKTDGKFLNSKFYLLPSGNNHMLGFSFFTKEIYLRVGGWPNIFWSDWGFWWLCYLANARCCHPPRTHVLVDDLSEGRISSRPNKKADLEMKNFIRSQI